MVNASFAQVWRRMGSSGFNPGPAPSCYVSLDKFLCLLYRILHVDLNELEGTSQALHMPTPPKELEGTAPLPSLLNQHDARSQCIFFHLKNSFGFFS